VGDAETEPDAKAIASAKWIKVQDVPSSPLLTTLLTFLDQGEAEAIALAIEIRADLVLLDESEARRMAEKYGLRKTGLLGVLIKAKNQGMLQSLKIYLDRLHSTGFHISESIYDKVLDAVNEKR